KKAMPDTGGGGEAPGGANPLAAGDPAVAASVDCPPCGQPNPGPGSRATPPSWGQPVYAVGRLRPGVASLGVEKEFAQLAAGEHVGDQVDVDLLRRVLSDPDNAYLARHLCWFFSGGGIDSFIALPREAELERLVEALSPAGAEGVVHAVV